ncbi:MAG: PIG-L family deacetylase [Muribaculaceae bacterium]|nr:PIG-L family deacetylase [Muribaculaceae bacterium]
MTPYYKYLRDSVAWARCRVLYSLRHFMSQMPYGKRVMIVAPHPDDETFGAGGYICSLLARRSKVRVIVLSSGGSSLGDSYDKAEVGRQRERLCLEATSILGLRDEDVIFLRQPDGNVLADTDSIEQLRHEIEIWRPDIVLTPGFTEVWPDHVNTADIVLQIVEDTCMVYHYWIWTWYYNIMPMFGHGYYYNNGRSHGYLKRKAIDIYLNSLTQDGDLWIGRLPLLLLNSIRQDDEIFCCMTVERR